VLAALAVLLVAAGASRGAEWRMPEIALPKAAGHPFIACTPEELSRAQAAWKGAGKERAALAAIVARADAALKQPPVFPPRGGQHNQWYQCDACQVALKTIDATHHQCPRCKKVYTGEPYDDVIFARQHGANLKNMADSAWAYAITGRREYAAFAAKVLLGYAERYEAYPYHSNSMGKGSEKSRSGGHLFEQTLNEANCMADEIAPAYDLIHDSGALSEKDHQAIREHLLAPMLRNVEKNHAGKSNWQTWHNAAFIWGGAMLGDARWVRLAVADPANGFAFQMKESVTPEGMWYENSWGYHFYTLKAMVAIAEGARRLGIDLWHHPSLGRMFTLPARYAMADGSLPRFGDDVQSSPRSTMYLAEPAWQALEDPALEALVPSQPTLQGVLFGCQAGGRGAPQPSGSDVFHGAGHAVLRTAGEAGLTAAMTFGPYGGFHGHYDKLSFVFFGFGRELGVDPGRAASQAYRLPVHHDWYKATIGHNAVLVDAAPQKPAEGRLEAFAAGPAYAAAVASCDVAYPGVHHRRMLCMTPSYLLVLDDLASDRPHRYDWIYHSRGTAARCEAAAGDGKLAETCPGQEYVQNVKAGATDQAVRIEFAGSAVTTYLTAAAGPKTEVRTGDGVGASIMDRVPLAVITRSGERARFACVLEPVAKGARPAVTAVSAEEVPAGIRVAVQRGGETDTILLAPDGRFTVASGGRTLLEGK
jgi:hypothetical protein